MPYLAAGSRLAKIAIAEEEPMMKAASHPSALKVQAMLGHDFEVMEFDKSTRTAEEAAAAIGCRLAEIAKSLVFRDQATGVAVIIIASGANRVDEAKVRRLIGSTIERAPPDFVRDVTGFAIGGVPPIGHAAGNSIFIDEDLMVLPFIWAAAGTPNAVFRLTPQELLEISGGHTADIKE
ncbi:YbaK/EbsC family protein, partial [Candidatus Raskinella chloraquaticus]